jgi:cyanophycinase-like exopeptidase
MVRPLHIEFAGALYHITSRGDRREAMFEDDEDRQRFLAVLGEVVARSNWVCQSIAQDCGEKNAAMVVANARTKNPDKIGVRVGRVINKYQMAEHIVLDTCRRHNATSAAPTATPRFRPS